MKDSVKMIIVGDSGVGKSCILFSYLYNKPCLYPVSSIGVDCHSKIITIKNKSIKLIVWDTVGQEYFLSITKSYYRNSDIVLLVFAINDLDSFKNIKKWISIIQNTHTNTYNENNISMFLVGNKVDCNDERKVSKANAELFAKENNLVYFELTHNKPENIDKSIQMMVTQYINSCEDNEFLLTPPRSESSTTIFDIVNMSGGDNYCCT